MVAYELFYSWNTTSHLTYENPTSQPSLVPWSNPTSKPSSLPSKVRSISTAVFATNCPTSQPLLPCSNSITAKTFLDALVDGVSSPSDPNPLCSHCQPSGRSPSFQLPSCPIPTVAQLPITKDRNGPHHQMSPLHNHPASLLSTTWTTFVTSAIYHNKFPAIVTAIAEALSP